MDLKIKLNGKELNDAIAEYVGCDCYLNKIQVTNEYGVVETIDWEKIDDITLLIEGFK
jgi:hypothetical protein